MKELVLIGNGKLADAFHRVQVGNENSSITIETKIEGATSYVEGLARIVQCLPELDRGNYEIDDLVTFL